MEQDPEYMILTPLGVEYSSKQYMESILLYSFKNEKESKKDFSLLNLEGSEEILHFEEFSPEEIEVRLKGCRAEIRINGDASADVGIDLLVYDLKRKLKSISPELFKTILDWEVKVRSEALRLGVAILPKVEIFVKVFTFIKLHYTTKYKKLADLFSMPLNLYIEFDKKFDPSNLNL